MLGITPPLLFCIPIHTLCALRQRWYPQGTMEGGFSAEPQPGATPRQKLQAGQPQAESGGFSWAAKESWGTGSGGWVAHPSLRENVLRPLVPVWHLRVNSVKGIQTGPALSLRLEVGNSESSGGHETVLTQTWVSVAGSKTSPRTAETSSITPTRDPILRKRSWFGVRDEAWSLGTVLQGRGQ